MKKNKVILLSLVLVIALAIISFGFAGEDGKKDEKKPMPRMKEFLEKLKLTPDQQKQMEKMKFDLEKQQVKIRAEMMTAGIELKELLAAEVPDKGAIEKKLDEVAKYRVNMEKARIDQWFAVNKTLTSDQQKVWKEILKNPPKQMGNRNLMMQRRMMGREGVGRRGAGQQMEIRVEKEIKE
jgi:Spy/CpxP family protein refolding chaperone